MTGNRFVYRKQWGAEVLGPQEVRFRLWAPNEPRVAVCGGESEAVPMDRREGGWFEVTTDRIAAGERYAFQLADGRRVPDPAARAQAGNVHEDSLLIDPAAYAWRTAAWRGRPWEEAVIYELHTGTFSEAGTFAGVAEKLGHLAETGVTAIELLPVAQFGGDRGWGYDGVLLYAPHACYGGPDGLKALVDAAHEQGLMVLLDVVYNHFGPDGNHLHAYAQDFFNGARETPWGPAIAYEQPAVRDFFVDNALYWLEEYRLDGLRLDAINQIEDPSEEHILEAIARRVRERLPDRHIHLTTEDDRNITRLHRRDEAGRPVRYTAEWNDDFHHAAHVAATGEAEGYYADYTDHPAAGLARALASGFVYQGETSRFWHGAARGEPSGHLPPLAFVNFLQNHDQTGNRAFGERLTDLASPRAVETLTAILLLSPQIPLLFMGEEWGETRPFAFFTDFHGALADAVREGRRREFRRFPAFADEATRDRIPDPNACSTFAASRLDWDRLATPEGRARHSLLRCLLDIRRKEIVPRLAGMQGDSGRAEVGEAGSFAASWRLGDGSRLTLLANLADRPLPTPMTAAGRVLFDTADDDDGAQLPAWSLRVVLEAAEAGRGA
ncbi:MAG: malto-oligosyltrehalose trehalohydrolase [Kiloniellaceae bacterium]